MEYVPPIGKTGEAPYVDGDPEQDIEGDAVSAKAWENTMREIVNAINYHLGTETDPTPASNGDLQQLRKAIEAAVTNGMVDALMRNVSATVTKGFWQTPVALAIEAGVATPDTVANNQWTLTIDEDVTIAAPDPIPDGGDGVLVLTIDGAGGHAISLDAAYRIAHGSINTDANAVNLIYMTINGDLVDLHISQRGAA